MFTNANRGYVGYSYSVRADIALNDFRYPISRFTRENINIFLDYYIENELELFTKEEQKQQRALVFEQIKKMPLKIWVAVAKNLGTKEWHHMSKYFNKVKFYDLRDIADYIEKHINELQTKQITNYTYCLCEFPVWGGSKRSPRIIDFLQYEGIIIGDSFYSKTLRKKASGNYFKKLAVSQDFNEYKKQLKKLKYASAGKRALDKIAKAHLK